jgi:hypothetical protein
MRFVYWASMGLVAVLILAGCGNFWQAPGGGGGGGGTTASSGNFYILNNGTTPQIVGKSIVTGTLTSITGSPWTLPATPNSSPNAMTISPNGKLLFVSTTAGVYVYQISSGQLGTGTQVTQDAAALAIGIDRTGSWLIEAIQATGGVTMGAVPINSTTGASTGTEQTASFNVTSASVHGMAISPDDTNIFVALGTGGSIVVPFDAGVASGDNPLGSTAATIAPKTSGGAALSVAVDPSTTPRLFYIGETLGNSSGNSGGVRAFVYSSLGNASLTQASGSPIAAGQLSPSFILPSDSGSYIYVADGAGQSSAGTINSFAITSSGGTYTIATGSSIAAGKLPAGLAEDNTNAFIFAVNSLGSPFFDAYTFNSTTAGKLDAQITANTGASPIAIVAAP